jgi:outer membrane protein assembly factor BamE (lipoprotein component of BamABCDE complex)
MTLEPTAAGSGAGDLRLLVTSLAIVLLLAGCASYDGRGLVPGQSRAADVEALMGAPTEKLTVGGDSVWFYNRNPAGLHVYAVRIAPDGVMRSIEQRLTVRNVHQLRPGSTTAQQVKELLGSPWRVTTGVRQGGEIWEYRMHDDTQKEHGLSVQFSADGLVRQVFLLREYVNEPVGT